jgi:hypothetical protein
MIVLLRCPNCGTTRTTTGTCEACHSAQVRYFCTNHKPGLWLDAPKCRDCGASFGDPPRLSSPAVITRPARARPAASSPLPRPVAPRPPPYTPTEPPFRSGPDVWTHRERARPVSEELETGVPPTPLWLTLLRNVVLARRGPAGGLPERAGPRRGVGGCLVRAALAIVFLFLGLLAMLAMFGWSLVKGY